VIELAIILGKSYDIL